MLKLFNFIVSNFFIKGTMSPKCLLIKNSRWLTKSIAIIKFHNRKFCRAAIFLIVLFDKTNKQTNKQAKLKTTCDLNDTKE